MSVMDAIKMFANQDAPSAPPGAKPQQVAPVVMPAPRPATRVFKICISDRPKEWMTVLGLPDLAEAQRYATDMFGKDRVLDVKEHVT